MQAAVIRQLARAGHICGTDVGDRYCILAPGHEGECTSDLLWFPSSPLMRERVRRAKAVVRHEAAERHVTALAARVQKLEERRGWVERFIGFRIEYRIRGACRRLRRYHRYVAHRTWQRRTWQAGKHT